MASGRPINDSSEVTAARRSGPVEGPGCTKAPNSAPDVPDPGEVLNKGSHTSTATRMTTAVAAASPHMTLRDTVPPRFRSDRLHLRDARYPPRVARSAETAYGRPVADDSRQRDLIMILARDLTSRLATPAFVVDADGTLAYFNEAAEPVLGARYAETGELPAGGWAAEWNPRDTSGAPVPLEQLPLGIAFREGRPAHLPLRIMGGDGIERDIEVTAFPLCARADEILGAIAIFWERAGS